MTIEQLFTDSEIIQRIQKKLPELFYMAELECSRAGRVGMEVGSMREKIIIALIIYKFGEKAVNTEIPITEPENDVMVFGQPISIKTVTERNLTSVKLIWTVDPEQALRFRNNYNPSCDTILAQINWGENGWLFFFPKQAQLETLKNIGRDKYIKLPKPGTNPRGVEISSEALTELSKNPITKKIQIRWERTQIDYDPYDRWIELWKKD